VRPYYEDCHTTIYHADARDAVDALPPVGLLLTDPSYGQSFTSNRVRGRKLKPTRNDGVRQSVRLYRQVLPLIQAQHVLWFCHWKAYPDVRHIGAALPHQGFADLGQGPSGARGQGASGYGLRVYRVGRGWIVGRAQDGKHHPRAQAGTARATAPRS
jgi:hypothetical protein